MMSKLRTLILIITTVMIGCSRQAREKVDGTKSNTADESVHNDNDLRIEFLYDKLTQYYQAKEFKMVVLYSDSLIALDSLNGDYYFKRGYAKAQLNNHKNSSEDFLICANLQYKVSKSYFNIGINEWVQRHDSLSIVYLKKALANDPADKKAREWLKLIEEGYRK